MPITDKDARVVEYIMPRLGVNFRKNPVRLQAEECFLTQNLIWRNGLVKRLGSVKFETDEVSTGKKITGLHRFYFGEGNKLLLVSSGTAIKEHNGSTWAVIDAVVGQSQTDGAVTHFATWGALGKTYIGNGVDAPIKYDGSTATLMNPTNLSTTVIQFLSYQDRLLAIDNTNLGDLTWSASFSDTDPWETVANCGVRPDTKLYGMVVHSSTNESTGYQSKVLLAGANGMYLFSGNDLRVPFTTGDYQIESLAIRTGCSAPRTMVWTPSGTMWLGLDKQVYLLPFNSLIPIPVGHKIQSELATINGLEGIPASTMVNAAAVYHDGFYKLSVTESGQTINKVQYWLDVDRLTRDDDTLYYGPWYGPMVGMNTSVFATQNGEGDSGELMYGEADASVGSFVYETSKLGIRGDMGTAIDIIFQSRYDPLSSTELLRVDESLALAKDVHKVEIEMLDTAEAVTIDYQDLDQSLATGNAFQTGVGGTYWGELSWSEFSWSNFAPVRQIDNLSPGIQARRLSMTIKHSSSTGNFQLYALRAYILEQNLIFAEV